MCIALPLVMGLGGDSVDFWVFLVAFHRCIGLGGYEVDFWVFAGIQVCLPPVVLRRSLYVIYSTCLRPHNVIHPGASCHCECRHPHLTLGTARAVRGFSGARFHTPRTACDALLVPPLHALHYRVPHTYLHANVYGAVVLVWCVVRCVCPRVDFFFPMKPMMTGCGKADPDTIMEVSTERGTSGFGKNCCADH
jgi:hypothetical protein